MRSFAHTWQKPRRAPTRPQRGDARGHTHPTRIQYFPQAELRYRTHTCTRSCARARAPAHAHARTLAAQDFSNVPFVALNTSNKHFRFVQITGLIDVRDGADQSTELFIVAVENELDTVRDMQYAVLPVILTGQV